MYFLSHLRSYSTSQPSNSTSSPPSAAPSLNVNTKLPSQAEITQDTSRKVENSIPITKVDSIPIVESSPQMAEETKQNALQRFWDHRIMKKIRTELHHYWVGTKLLALNVKTAWHILMKMAEGNDITRRERRLLIQTSIDLFRLVPFAVFVIVPFMEFLLPVALKLFPNMLPSTFEGKLQKEENRKKQLKVKLEMAKFLQDTLYEQTKTANNPTTQDFRQFIKKVKSGDATTNEDLYHFSKLFENELTLDNLSHEQLVAMCRYMNLNPYGTTGFLRYQLDKKLEYLKKDDKDILQQGVDNMTLAELQSACAMRGMSSIKDKTGLKKQLNQWLELSIQKNVPSSLLILSRAFMITKKKSQEAALRDTLLALSPEMVKQISAKCVDLSGKSEDRDVKLEMLKKQVQLVREEEEVGEAEYKRIPELFTLEQMKEISEAISVLASSSAVSKEKQELEELKKILEAQRKAKEEKEQQAIEHERLQELQLDQLKLIQLEKQRELEELQRADEQRRKEIESLPPEEKKLALEKLEQREKIKRQKLQEIASRIQQKEEAEEAEREAELAAEKEVQKKKEKKEEEEKEVLDVKQKAPESKEPVLTKEETHKVTENVADTVTKEILQAKDQVSETPKTPEEKKPTETKEAISTSADSSVVTTETVSNAQVIEQMVDKIAEKAVQEKTDAVEIPAELADLVETTKEIEEVKLKIKKKTEEKKKEALLKQERDRVISKLENKLDALLEELGEELALADSEIKNSFNVIDEDKDGVITLDEFIKASQLLKDKLSTEEVGELFQQIDINRDGKISVEELAKIPKMLEIQNENKSIKIRDKLKRAAGQLISTGRRKKREERDNRAKEAATETQKASGIEKVKDSQKEQTSPENNTATEKLKDSQKEQTSSENNTATDKPKDSQKEQPSSENNTANEKLKDSQNPSESLPNVASAQQQANMPLKDEKTSP